MATMKPEVAIMQALLTDSGITSAISSRMWAGYAPQDSASPFIIVRRASTEIDYKATGPSGMRDLECDIWITGESYATITDIAELVIQKMHSAVHNTTITSGSDSITFRKAFMSDMGDEQEAIDDGTGKPIRRIYQRWRLNHQYE